VNAVPIYFFPEAVAKMWQVLLKRESTKFMFYNLGYFLLEHCLTVLIGGKDGMADAIGWSSLAIGLSLLGLLLSE